MKGGAVEGILKVAAMIVVLAIVATLVQSKYTVGAINAVARGFSQSIEVARGTSRGRRRRR